MQFSVSFYAGCSTRWRNTILLLPRMMLLEMTLTFSGNNSLIAFLILRLHIQWDERKWHCLNVIFSYRDIKFNYCILDEGHVIKNGKTKLSKAIKQLTANYRMILSGTPIQVRIELLDGLYTVLFKSLWSVKTILTKENVQKTLLQSSVSHDHSEIILLMLKKHLLLSVIKTMHFFFLQNSLMIRKFIRTAFIWNRKL